MRRLVIVSLALLAAPLLAALPAAVPAEASGADPKVALLGLGSPKGQRCRSVIGQLVREQTKLIDVRRLGLGEPPDPREGDEAIADWIESRRGKGGPGAIIVAELLDPGRLRLAVYRLPEARLSGLRILDVGKGCRIEARPRVLTARWLAAQLRPRPASPRPAPPEEPEPPPRVEPEEDEAPEEELEPEEETGEPADPIDEEITSPLEAPRTETRQRKKSQPRRRLTRSAPRWLSAELRLNLGSRSFRYSGAQTSNLREYRFELVPIPGLAVELWPFLQQAEGALQKLWVAAAYQHTIALRSNRIEGGAPLPTSWSDLDLRLGYRFDLAGLGGRMSLLPSTGFHWTRFSLGESDDGGSDPLVPGVSYPSLIAGLKMRVPFKERIELEAGAAYLLVLGRGEALSGFFPDGNTHGLELAAGFSVKLAPRIELHLGATLLRYFLSFQPEEDAVRVAGGAGDESISLRTALRFSFDPPVAR